MKQIKTDCVCVEVPQKHVDRVKAIAEQHRHNDGSKMYRVEEKVKPLMGIYHPPCISCPDVLPRPEWRAINDCFAHVLEGNSILIQGLPGTGKTTLRKKLIGALREKGKHVDVISKTHCAVQNIGCGAMTADRWIRQHIISGSCSADTLVIEEITMIDVHL